MRFAAAAARRGEVAVVAHDLARLARGLLQRRPVGDGVVARVRAVVPDDLQRVASLHRRPGVARDHGDAAERIELRRARRGVDLHDLHDARHLERRGRVDAHDLAAEHLRSRDHGVEHAGQARVHAVLRLAGDDVLRVDELQLARADVAELRRILELDRVHRGHRHARRRLGERAVAELAGRSAVHHLAVLRLHFADRHLPARGGRGFQHLARRGAAAAHRHEEVARAARAVGVLVAVALLVAGRLHDAHARPVGFELVGDDHRHAGAHALAHLGAMADDADDAVLADRDEHQRVVDPAVRHAVGAVLGRVRGAQRRRGIRRRAPARRARSALQELPPAHVGDHQRSFGRLPDPAPLLAVRSKGAFMPSLLSRRPPA